MCELTTWLFGVVGGVYSVLGVDVKQPSHCSDTANIQSTCTPSINLKFICEHDTLYLGF